MNRQVGRERQRTLSSQSPKKRSAKVACRWKVVEEPVQRNTVNGPAGATPSKPTPPPHPTGRQDHRQPTQPDAVEQPAAQRRTTGRVCRAGGDEQPYRLDECAAAQAVAGLDDHRRVPHAAAHATKHQTHWPQHLLPRTRLPPTRQRDTRHQRSSQRQRMAGSIRSCGA